MSAPKTRDGIRLADTSGLPVSSLREAAPFLRRPFMPNAVGFRTWECWGEDGGPLTHVSVVAYVDSRLVVERLNLVCPDLWSEDFEMAGGHLWCAMTLRMDGMDGTTGPTLTRRDIGDTYGGKGLVSDARKRAAVQFGVGVSLYAVPKVPLSRLAPDDEDDVGPVLLREWREQINGEWRDTLTLTLAGERYCRDRYRSWLLKTGIPAFGYPIDHGDVADCPGMVEILSPAPQAPKRASRQRQRPTAPEPSEQLSPEAELMALLAITEDGLHAERFACDSAMKAYGVEPAKRLQELTAAKDRRGLEALLVRLSNVPKAADERNEDDPIATLERELGIGSDDEQPIENEGDTTA